MSKISPERVIDACCDCPEYDYYYENFQDSREWCTIEDKDLEDPSTIPEWCPLQDEKPVTTMKCFDCGDETEKKDIKPDHLFDYGYKCPKCGLAIWIWTWNDEDGDNNGS